jgi:hypothetical protein
MNNKSNISRRQPFTVAADAQPMVSINNIKLKAKNAKPLKPKGNYSQKINQEEKYGKENNITTPVF